MRRRLLLVIAMVLALAGCLQYVAPPGPAPLRYRDEVFPGVTETHGVPFATALDQQGNQVTLRLDVYQPTGDTAATRPAIVWIHPGSFSGGTRTSPEIVDEARWFARRGYVGFSIDYRLAEHGCSASDATQECVIAIRDAMHDAQTAVRYVRANAAAYRIDPDRIAIAGTSAGAITALNVGFSGESPGPGPYSEQSSRVRAAVSLSGARIFGTPDPADAPSFLLHGTADAVVPYAWAVNTVDAATAVGLVSLLTSWSGAGHVPYAQHRTEILEQTRNFLYQTLDLLHA